MDSVTDNEYDISDLKTLIDEYIRFCRVNDLGKKSNYDYLTHRHHILPKSMGGANSVNNYTRLTVDNHIKAHEMLVKIACGDDRAKMRSALQYILNMTGKGGSYGHKKSLLVNLDLYNTYKPIFVNYSKLRLVKHKVSPNASGILEEIYPTKKFNKFNVKIINTLFHLSEREVFNFWIHNETNANKRKILDTFKILSESGYMEIIKSIGGGVNIFRLTDKFISVPVDFTITDNILDIPSWSCRPTNYKKNLRWEFLHNKLVNEMCDLVITVYNDHYMFAAKELHKMEELDTKYNGILYKKFTKIEVDKMLTEMYPHIFDKKRRVKLYS